MKIIGFNFAKVSAEKSKEFKLGSKISTNIKFLDIEKEESGIIKEESETLRISFNFLVKYADTEKQEKEADRSEVLLMGFIILMATREESKLLLDSWKKKELPVAFRVPIFNFILKKCSVRALQLEEELGLPLHISLPQLKASEKVQKEEKK